MREAVAGDDGSGDWPTGLLGKAKEYASLRFNRGMPESLDLSQLAKHTERRDRRFCVTFNLVTFLFLDLVYLFCYKEKKWPGPSATIPKTRAIPRVGFVADHPDRSGNDRAQIAYMRGSHNNSQARAPSYIIF